MPYNTRKEKQKKYPEGQMHIPKETFIAALLRQKMVSTQRAISSRMNNHDTVIWGILLRMKRHKILLHMEESQMHYVKWKNPVAKVTHLLFIWHFGRRLILRDGDHCLLGIDGEGASDSKGRFRDWTLTMVVTGIYVCVKLIALYTEKKMNSTVCQFKTIYIEWKKSDAQKKA